MNTSDETDPTEGERRTTYRDIAAELGISESTVSRALSSSSRRLVAEATRLRIEQIVAERGLTLTPKAGPRARTRRGLLGLIVRSATDAFFPSLIGAVIAEARAAGWRVILGYADNRAVEARQLEEILETRRCRAIMLIGDCQGGTFADELRATSLPVVGLCQGGHLPGVSNVNTDNKAGCRLVLEQLNHDGHERIAFVGSHEIGDLDERLSAFRAFMLEKKFDIPEGYESFTTNDAAGGYQALLLLAGLNPRPTAVFAATDHIAIGCLKAASRLHIAVPDTMAIAGFDDIPLSEYTIPSLTTVRQPVRDLAIAGLRMLHSLEEGQPVKRSELVPVRLIVRESTGPHKHD
jgi:DNA-binding LacI/PurR family transcriptional regulator